MRILWPVGITYLPHAADRMEEFGISVAAIYRVLADPDSEGEANMGRLWAQKRIGERRVRVAYTRDGDDGRIVVTAMLRRR